MSTVERAHLAKWALSQDTADGANHRKLFSRLYCNRKRARPECQRIHEPKTTHC